MATSATAAFYSSDIFVDEVDFTPMVAPEGVPPLQTERVEIPSAWLSMAAVTIAGVITIVSSALAPAMTSVTFEGAKVTESPGDTSGTRVHILKSERAKRLFSSVPLGAAEQLPDPDYGL